LIINTLLKKQVLDIENEQAVNCGMPARLDAKKADNQYIRFFIPFTGFNPCPTTTPCFMGAVEVVAEVEDADLH
jgi:hypothetical protein